MTASIIPREKTDQTPQEVDVDVVLSQAGIAYTVRLVEFDAKRDHCGGKPWTCDKWLATFTKGAAAESFEYYTGTGHRKLKLGLKVPQDIKPGTTAYRNYTAGQFVPVMPCAASVLCCLLLDAEAATESFSSWCDNFGLSTDSISAFNQYQECEKTARRLRRVFNHADVSAVRELLQDY